MHNPQFVQVVDGVQHLSNQVTGISLCVVPLCNDPVKQLSSGHSVSACERVMYVHVRVVCVGGWICDHVCAFMMVCVCEGKGGMYTCVCDSV